ncbi:hypothetical protein HP397_04065 [Streptobacillus felis]|uniref:Uncharacterized protein n=1 Tax=Streptobacillus felis TaxID=1384509 RepID=A0A7Z0PFA8_9FUSO|nr:hypothetical protein [Streptobacillus felis]NYV27989.1 hypothetical protein [Streptobacillus felis]
MKIIKRIIIGLIFIGIGLFLLGNNVLKLERYVKDNKEILKIEEKVNEEIEVIEQIEVENFAGIIDIEKGTKNSIKIEENYDNLNFSFENGILKIYTRDDKVVKNNKTLVKITYTEDKMDINVENMAGIMTIDAPMEALLNFENIAGKIKVNVEKDVKVDSDNVLGKVVIDADNNEDSTLNITMENIVGEIIINKK